VFRNEETKMQAIFKRELKSSLLTVKSLIILLFFLLISYWISKYSPVINQISGEKNSVISVIYGAIETLGVFFGFMMFSGTIAKIVENESIRYIISYTTRIKLIIGKYLAMNVYFIILLCLMVPIVMFVRGVESFPFLELIQAIIFFMYVTSIILLLSVVTRRERTANFVGIVLGFVIPILGLYSVVSKNWVIRAVSWLLPYRYDTLRTDSIFLVFLSLILVGISIKIFSDMEV
jgi:ABC-2 type transport system permease protein